MTARAGVIKELKRLQTDQLPGFTRYEIGELIGMCAAIRIMCVARWRTFLFNDICDT